MKQVGTALRAVRLASRTRQARPSQHEDPDGSESRPYLSVLLTLGRRASSIKRFRVVPLVR
ncbi:MAG: hypothetical protein QOG67_3962 [Verrucomicrobiota bacterium]